MISSSNIEQLTPDFLQESGLLMLVVLDVEGRVLSGNRLLHKNSGLSEGDLFADSLPKESKKQLNEILEELILSPKKNIDTSFRFKSGTSFDKCKCSWEFSVVTDSHMDIMGIVGLGIDPVALSPIVKIDSLIDLLGLGRITLDSGLKIIDGDPGLLQKLGVPADKMLGKSILKLFPKLGFEKLLGNQDLKDGFFKTEVKLGSTKFALLGIKELDKYHLFFSGSESIDSQLYGLRKPMSNNQITAIPGAVWILDVEGVVVQQNLLARNFSIENFGKESTVGSKLNFQGPEFEQKLRAFQTGASADFILSKPGNDSYSVHFGQLVDTTSNVNYTLVQINSLTLSPILERLQQENRRLKEVALKPSHILRSPLSSMLGLLDLIDQEQLDIENKKYFSYLKPLATELDHVIRANAKKMSSLD